MWRLTIKNSKQISNVIEPNEFINLIITIKNKNIAKPKIK